MLESTAINRHSSMHAEMHIQYRSKNTKVDSRRRSISSAYTGLVLLAISRFDSTFVVFIVTIPRQPMSKTHDLQKPCSKFIDSIRFTGLYKNSNLQHTIRFSDTLLLTNQKAQKFKVACYYPFEIFICFTSSQTLIMRLNCV